MQAVARIVHDRGSMRFALPTHTTQEIVDHPKATPVPGAPRHAIGLLEWQGVRIPLIDVAVLMGASPPREREPRYALVVATQAEPGAPIEHGALALDTLPETVDVLDTAACDIPQGPVWRRVAVSCFEKDGLPVPILDTARIFGT